MNLTGNTALDVAIALAFTFLLFSLLCSAIQEGIAGVLDLRARKLEDGLRSMLTDQGPGTAGAPAAPDATQPAEVTGPVAAAAQAAPAPVNQPAAASVSLFDQVLAHDLIRSSYKDALHVERKTLATVTKVWPLTKMRTRRGPSYISGRSFALALLDLLTPGDSAGDPLAGIQHQIENSNLPAGTKSTLLTMAGKLAKNRDHLRGIVEQWFDDTMGRVSGWYKRQAQIILCVIAAVVTIGLNVNTVAITQRMLKDDSARAAVVQQAAKPTPTTKNPVADIDKVGQLGVPFGWGNKKAGDPSKVSGHVPRAILGWLLTFIALSLGAPFWFDALSKLARLRTTGVPEAPHEASPRKDAGPSVVVTEKATTSAGVETTTQTTMPG